MKTVAVLAIDIGGTKTAAGLVDAEGKVIDSETAATPAQLGPDAIIQNLAKLARILHGRNKSVELVGLGISATGVVDVATGSIVSSTDTMYDWAGTALAERAALELADILKPGCPVKVVNDVEAHANGEFLLGAAKGFSSYLVVAVGTGVCSGVVVNGAPLRGAHHLGGEIAHMPTPGAEHLRCPCGRMGHLEAIGSGHGIHRHFLSLGGSSEVLDTKQIVSLAKEKDALAIQALYEAGAAVGKALAGAVSILDPEVIVITGGVADIGELWWSPMEESFRAELIDVAIKTPLLKGTLGAQAPLIGVAGLVWREVKDEH